MHVHTGTYVLVRRTLVRSFTAYVLVEFYGNLRVEYQGIHSYEYTHHTIHHPSTLKSYSILCTRAGGIELLISRLIVSLRQTAYVPPSTREIGNRPSFQIRVPEQKISKVCRTTYYSLLAPTLRLVLSKFQASRVRNAMLVRKHAQS